MRELEELFLQMATGGSFNCESKYRENVKVVHKTIEEPDNENDIANINV